MKMNKTLALLAASATVAVSASTASAVNITGYIPINVTGSLTEGFQAPNGAGTKEIYTSKSTAINNAGTLALLHSWYAWDGSTAIASFTTAGYKLGVLWDYTTEEPETGDIVVLDKSGNLVYDPTAVDAADHSFTIGMNWNTPCILNGSAVLLPGTSENIYNINQGAGTLNYELTGDFALFDDTTSSIAVADLHGDGKCLGTATFNAVGIEDKVGFKYTAFGSAQEYLEGTTLGTDTAVIELTISSGTVNITSSSPSNQPF